MAESDSTRWNNLNIAFQNYQCYISGKGSDRYALSIIDLLHIRNFKGGNSSIIDSAADANLKLQTYRAALESIGARFGAQRLRSLTRGQLRVLKKHCTDFIGLTQNPATQISGFGPSYASALAAAHFPHLIPILDRRALNGAGIAVLRNSQGQVMDIQRYYPALIDYFYEYCLAQPGMSVRDLDRELFIRPLTATRKKAKKTTKKKVKKKTKKARSKTPKSSAAKSKSGSASKRSTKRTKKRS